MIKKLNILSLVILLSRNSITHTSDQIPNHILLFTAISAQDSNSNQGLIDQIETFNEKPTTNNYNLLEADQQTQVTPKQAGNRAKILVLNRLYNRTDDRNSPNNINAIKMAQAAYKNAYNETYRQSDQGKATYAAVYARKKEINKERRLTVSQNNDHVTYATTSNNDLFEQSRANQKASQETPLEIKKRIYDQVFNQFCNPGEHINSPHNLIARAKGIEASLQAYRKAYRESNKGKAAHKNYEKSDKGIIAQAAAYARSKERKLAAKQNNNHATNTTENNHEAELN